MVGRMLVHVRTEFEAEVDSILTRAANGHTEGWRRAEDTTCVFPGEASPSVWLEHGGFCLNVRLSPPGRVIITGPSGNESRAILDEMALAPGAIHDLEEAFYPEEELVPMTDEQAAIIAAIKIAEDA